MVDYDVVTNENMLAYLEYQDAAKKYITFLKKRGLGRMTIMGAMRDMVPHLIILAELDYHE